MTHPHTVVLAAALVALLCFTCVGFARFRPPPPASRRERSLFRILDRSVAGMVIERGSCGCGLADRLDGLPAMDQVVAELRRLYRMRCGGGLARDSRLWSAAVESAYDRWLQVACHYLAVSHHLFALTDMDREIERLRIESELAAAGLAIRT